MTQADRAAQALERYFVEEWRAEKRCAFCHKSKARALFYRNAAHRDGRESYCMACRRAINAVANLWRAQHPVIRFRDGRGRFVHGVVRVAA